MDPSERYVVSDLLLILLTILLPPFGVFTVTGCSSELCINIILTILGYLPGHIHAFYVEYVYFRRRDEQQAYAALAGEPAQQRQPPQYQDYGAV